MTIRDTLLLDQGYQPLRVIPWQRALCMHYLGKVELLSSHAWPIRTVSDEFAAPAVVRLLRSLRVRPMHVRFSRDNVHLRDGYQCQYCRKPCRGADLTLDHVIPRCQGGKTNWKNVVTACVECNRRKGRHDPDEAGMPLLRPPARPRWLAPRVFHIGEETLPKLWRDWMH